MTDRKQAEKAIRELIDRAQLWLVLVEGEWGGGASYEKLLAMGDEDAQSIERAESALRSLLSETQEENWEYATVSEITPAQLINVAHVDYWRGLGYEIVRRPRASDWEPVPVEEER